MKQITTLAALLALLGASTAMPASAADIYGSKDGPSRERDSDFQNVDVNAFKGFAVGVDIGGQFTSININDQFDGISADGIDGGINVEYLFSAGRLRFGPYAEAGYSNVNVGVDFGGGSEDLLTQDYHFGGGLKAGTILGSSTLLFAKLGYERASWSSDFFDQDITVDSFVIGGGLETMVTDRISFGLGVDYLMINNVEADGDDFTKFLDESEGLRAKARVTYHLN